MHLVKEQFYNFKNSLLMKNEKYNKTLIIERKSKKVSNHEQEYNDKIFRKIWRELDS